MAKYRAEQDIFISGWECGTEFEIKMVVTFTMTKYYPASNDGPEELPQPEIETIRFFRDLVAGAVEVDLPLLVRDSFIDSENFMLWLSDNAIDMDEIYRDDAADARREELRHA